MPSNLSRGLGGQVWPRRSSEGLYQSSGRDADDSADEGCDADVGHYMGQCDACRGRGPLVMIGHTSRPSTWPRMHREVKC